MDFLYDPQGVLLIVKGATGTEKVMTWLYRNLLLFPKATAQLAKPVFSIPTHLRNFLSAGAFAAANGVLFEGIIRFILLISL